MPAAKKWFSRGAPSDLQLEYLQPHGSTLLPMELTRRTGQQTTFNKANAPLSLFLSWENSSHGADHCRLYIAQAPLASLPEQLQKDVPAPAIVSQAGKGDVYDANLWMGAPPTYTPLHKDPNPNLLVQLAGCKTVRLMSPEEGEAIFASVQEALGRSTPASWRGDEMMQGYEHELLESRIWREALGDEMPDAPAGFEARLEGGDGIFIPRGWWHSIKGTGSGITASVGVWMSCFSRMVTMVVANVS